MIIKQLSVFLENKSGRLSDVTEALSENGINISALSVADTSEYGILRLIVGRPEKAYELLKNLGFSVSLTDVICLIIPNESGTLYKAIKVLASNGVSIEYMYAYAMNGDASVIMKVSEVNKAIETLTENDVELAKASEICN
ncbi:amino acid-binding protein [Vallitalea longa]|uniref:Amino acid-binding protein n=1 Tax=Vallitalea longa TaxID=2936439 RepID=A0A9W6DFB4_9FIRM|nr:ACT domain-containing protein [Vallitalea longa]GKX30405.1 amino acid-binding protein [Vallitalea longa]